MTASILFLGGIRLSTWLCIAAFFVLDVVRRDHRPLLAAVAWLLGFEAAFEASALAYGKEGPTGPIHALLYIIVGPLVAAWIGRRGIRPAPTMMLLVGIGWAAWLAIGFDYNLHTTVGLDPVAEAFNEAIKTLWAFAYLWPLVLSRGAAPSPRPPLFDPRARRPDRSR